MTASDRNGTPLVLVADDDADILALVTFRLDRGGCDVVTASDGEEALRIALERRPDLAVLDVMMPKLTGYEVTRALRADERTQAIPVLLLTARVEETDVAEGIAAGANEYVKKPFSPQELGLRVQALLASR